MDSENCAVKFTEGLTPAKRMRRNDDVDDVSGGTLLLQLDEAIRSLTVSSFSQTRRDEQIIKKLTEREQLHSEQLSKAESENAAMAKRMASLKLLIDKSVSNENAQSAIPGLVDSSFDRAETLIREQISERNSKIYELEQQVRSMTSKLEQSDNARLLHVFNEAREKLPATIERVRSLEGAVQALRERQKAQATLIEAASMTQKVVQLLEAPAASSTLARFEAAAFEAKAHATHLQKVRSTLHDDLVKGIGCDGDNQSAGASHADARLLEMKANYGRLQQTCSDQTAQILELKSQLEASTNMLQQAHSQVEALQQQTAELKATESRKIGGVAAPASLHDHGQSVDTMSPECLSFNLDNLYCQELLKMMGNDSEHGFCSGQPLSPLCSELSPSRPSPLGRQLIVTPTEATAHAQVSGVPGGALRRAKPGTGVPPPAICILCKEPHFGLMVSCSQCGLSFHSHCIDGHDGAEKYVCTTCR
eukprot:INCI18796.3.p1 GENE.INCI18796.3~~INCI18796.3.p1  ORF type:complete len:478 (+),score=97.22 INCI18796.3:539-1972(+)